MRTQTLPSALLGKQTDSGFYPYSYESQDWNYYGSSLYGDQRLDNRKSSLVSRMIEKQSTIITQLSDDESELRGFQRILSHHSLSPNRMITDLVDRNLSDIREKELFVLLDTCSLSFLKLRARLRDDRGLGFTDTLKSWGCFLHLALVIEAQGGKLIGISEALIWSLTPSAFGYAQRKRESEPIEQKSSYRWLWAAKSSKVRLSQAKKITFIADREADIYEALTTLPDSRTHLIIRSSKNSKNRNILEGSGKLSSYVDQLPVAGRVECSIRADKRIPRLGRKAHLELRFSTVHLKRPYRAMRSNIKAYPQSIPIQVVDIREVDPPEREEPIHWCLYTTDKVNNLEQAIEVVKSYRKRWYIEQLFRLLKNQGLRIENNRLFSGMAILRLLIMALEAATAILKLDLAYKTEEFIPIEEVFDPKEQLCLEQLNQNLQGNTARLQNPFGRKSLTWATWIIARLGGWKGDPKKVRPGPITLKRGYTRFLDIYLGFLIQNPEIDTS